MMTYYSSLIASRVLRQKRVQAQQQLVGVLQCHWAPDLHIQLRSVGVQKLPDAKLQGQLDAHLAVPPQLEKSDGPSGSLEQLSIRDYTLLSTEQAFDTTNNN